MGWRPFLHTAGSILRQIAPGTINSLSTYRIEATYAASAMPATLAGPATVVLRYAVHSTMLLQSVGSGWKALPTTRFAGSQQVLADTDSLGIFVPAGP
ncbi:MAG TPA: hypothetical protein VKV57_11840 [bacterium]|nr:hypothetical protein [bacterium]